MAGVTEPVFRMLCLEQGAGLGFTEMVSAKGLSYGNENTQRLLERAPGEMQVAVQLFGDEPELLAQQAFALGERMGEALALVDINMGCPVGKVVKKGAGCALMENPARAARIVSEVSTAVACPVTAKFRRGYRLGEESCVEFARTLERAGVAAVTVHGRYAMQYYKGASAPSAIARVKQAVGVPVIASGDLLDPTGIACVLGETGADGAMVARGARGNPWIFSRTHALLRGGVEVAAREPSAAERVEMARRHTRGLAQVDGASLMRMRQNLTGYFKGMPHASAYRARANTCETLAEFEALYDAVLADAADETGDTVQNGMGGCR